MSRLKEIRESKGYSQSQFAEMCGISVRTLQDYEQGKRDIQGASVERVYRMAKVLGAKIEEIAELE